MCRVDIFIVYECTTPYLVTLSIFSLSSAYLQNRFVPQQIAKPPTAKNVFLVWSNRWSHYFNFQPPTESYRPVSKAILEELIITVRWTTSIQCSAGDTLCYLWYGKPDHHLCLSAYAYVSISRLSIDFRTTVSTTVGLKISARSGAQRSSFCNRLCNGFRNWLVYNIIFVLHRYKM